MQQRSEPYTLALSRRSAHGDESVRRGIPAQCPGRGRLAAVCVPGMVTPSIFMSRSPVRQTVRNANRQPLRSQATAAVASSTSGSRNRRCTRRRANRNRF